MLHVRHIYIATFTRTISHVGEYSSSMVLIWDLKKELVQPRESLGIYGCGSYRQRCALKKDVGCHAWRSVVLLVPSGNLLRNYGKSPCFMGISSINGPFSIVIAMLNYQRVSPLKETTCIAECHWSP